MLAVAVLLSFTMSVQASEKIVEYSSCTKDLTEKKIWQLQSPNPESIMPYIKQVLERCEKEGHGKPKEQWKKVKEYGFEKATTDKKYRDVVEAAIIEERGDEIRNQASFNNAWTNAGFQCIAIGAGYLLRMAIEKKW